MAMVGVGTKSVLKYGWAGSSANKVFGQGQTITAFDRENNAEGLFTLGQRTWGYFVAKQYAVRMSAEWILSNPWFLKAALGKGTTSGSTPPYTHTFTIPNPETDGEISAIDIVSYTPEQGTVTISNAKVASCRIAATQSEPARVACDFIGESDSVLSASTSAVIDIFDPYTFAQGTLKYYSGGQYYDIGYVRSIELTMSNELEQLYTIGSRTPEKILEKNFVLTGRMNIILNSDSDILKRFYGSTSSTSPETVLNKWTDIYLKFTKTENEYIEFHISGIVLDTYSLPQSPTEVIVEDVGFIGNTITAVAKNSTSAIP